MAPPLNKLLIAYSALLTTALAGLAVSQAVSQPTTQAIDTLDVHRINLREKDGTLRMVISNKDRFPGIIFRGKEYPHPSRNDAAGMIFFNDEGTENGGLIFGGAKKDGHVTSYGHLSFDQYENDQVVTLQQSEQDGHRRAGITIDDRPSTSMDIPAMESVMAMPDGPAKTKAMAGLADKGFDAHNRLFVGKSEGVSMLSLRDAAGHERLRMKVTPEGAAAIEFLDATGKVVRTVTPQAG